jgi:hypothetical protein
MKQPYLIGIRRYINSDDQSFNVDKYSNQLQHGGSKLNLSKLSFRSPSGGLDVATAPIYFGKKAGMGETAAVLLWHSGFWITLIKQAELIQLNSELRKSQIELVRDTLTVIKVLFIKG